MDNKNLTDIFEGTENGTPLPEILILAEKTCPSIDLGLIEKVDNDVIALFSGSSADFQKNTLPYHNLRHSRMVVLAAMRLFHGLHGNHMHISAETLFKGLLAAYFHDTGMLLEKGDPAPSAASYIAGHEARSVQFLNNYVTRKGFGEDISRDCATIIYYTNLASDPSTFASHSKAIHLAGQVIGSADILAQMADRYYLECLPLLFDEQKSGGINQHHSALELMAHTAEFYHDVVLKRLTVTFADTSEAMQTHFRIRYKVDRDLYLENIDKNITYLKKIIMQCDGLACLEKSLKRIPPST
jgi:hypothetical protein